MRVAAALFIAALVMGWWSDARGNAARPWDPGDATAEPIGRIREVSITHERLFIDARAFAEGGDATISATYTLLCAEEAVDLPLVFVSPGIENGEVRLDGELVAVERQGVDALPSSWGSPSTTPREGRDPLEYAAPIEHILAFRARLTRGEHELTVRYDARPTAHHRATLVNMQLAYLLAPARDWGGFGTLHVEVVAPADWVLHADPALSRTDAGWAQDFDGLPADALSLTFEPPRPVVREKIPWLMFLIAVGVCGLGGRRGGEMLTRRFGGTFEFVAGGFVLSALGSMVVMGGWFLGLAIMEATLPHALLARDTDYDALGVAALGILLGFAVTVAALVYGRSRVRL